MQIVLGRNGSSNVFQLLEINMLKSIGKVVSLLGLVISLQAHAAGPVVVGVDAENPPFMSAVAGKAAGLYPAIITEVFRSAGLSVQLEAKPWKRCIADMDEGRAGVGGIYKNDDRLKKYDFSNQIFVEKMAVYSNKAGHVEFTGVSSLFGKRVAVLRGWSYGEEFDKAVKEGKITTEETGSDLQNFQKLASNRVQVALAIVEAGTTLLKGGKFPEVDVSAKFLFENPTFLAFNKSTKQTETLDKFNKAIDDMRKSGKLEKIAAAELSK
jgi:polar amino acid transport system substrate-binding protein